LIALSINTVSKPYQNRIKTISIPDQNDSTFVWSIDGPDHDLPSILNSPPNKTPGFDRQKKNFARHAATRFAQLASPQHFPKTPDPVLLKLENQNPKPAIEHEPSCLHAQTLWRGSDLLLG
jgi:hypothetical protein